MSLNIYRDDRQVGKIELSVHELKDSKKVGIEFKDVVGHFEESRYFQVLTFEECEDLAEILICLVKEGKK